jgi:hypothetical protein
MGNLGNHCLIAKLQPPHRSPAVCIPTKPQLRTMQTLEEVWFFKLKLESTCGWNYHVLHSFQIKLYLVLLVWFSTRQGISTARHTATAARS